MNARPAPRRMTALTREVWSIVDKVSTSFSASSWSMALSLDGRLNVISATPPEIFKRRMSGIEISTGRVSSRHDWLEPLSSDLDPRLFTVPGIFGQTFGTKQMLLYFLRRRLWERVDNPHIAWNHEVGHSREQKLQQF